MKRTLNKKFIKGFTLVELIIVITILAILATIAFISFQGYSKNARDGNRLATMKNIEKGLILYQVQTGNYPQPDESINIEASGTLIGYQGKVGDAISRMIKINVTPTDPYDKEKYIYSTSSDKTKYQILGYLETTDYLTFLNQSYAAVDYSNRYVKTLGDKVGVILDANKSPISGVAKVDVATGSTTYNVYFGDNDSINGSGSVLFSNMYTRRVDLQNNKNLSGLDNSLIGYWDMETMSGGKLRDFSKYGNDGTLNGGVTVGLVDGMKGKATYFDGVDDYISLNNSITGTFSEMTVLLGYYTNIPNQVYILDFGADTTYKRVSLAPKTWRVLNHTFNGINVNETNQNNYVALTYNSSIGVTNYYVNGVKNNSYSLTGLLNLTNPPGENIGTRGVIMDSSNYFRGIIDEVRIYNRALSDTEIQSLYSSLK